MWEKGAGAGGRRLGVSINGCGSERGHPIAYTVCSQTMCFIVYRKIMELDPGKVHVHGLNPKIVRCYTILDMLLGSNSLYSIGEEGV